MAGGKLEKKNTLWIKGIIYNYNDLEIFNIYMEILIFQTGEPLHIDDDSRWSFCYKFEDKFVEKVINYFLFLLNLIIIRRNIQIFY